MTRSYRGTIIVCMSESVFRCLFLMGLLVGVGCGGRQTVPTGPVQKLVLLTAPAAVNLDDKPGQDGVPATVYFGQVQPETTVRVTEGELELLVFEGHVRDPIGTGAAPNSRAVYSAESLAPRGARTGVGLFGYRVVGRWKPPIRSDQVTLLARYIRPDGQVISSAPVSVRVRLAR
ncbi:MAG: hypothetical protein AAF517_28785 [Planctomycetota bacterium]